MTLFQDPDAVPRTAASRLADVLDAFGAVGDRAAGNAPGTARRKAAAAASIARATGRGADDANALYFAGLLHAVGAIGNLGLRRGNTFSDRTATMARWDFPADGARVCAGIAALPPQVADLVRWQAEAWDGTGFPDQLRWHGIPTDAQLLQLADVVARASDPDEALVTVANLAGRGIGPDHANAFVRWFHLTGGEPEPVEMPLDALRAEATPPAPLLDLLADRIDAHNAGEGRRLRVTRLADAVAERIALPVAERDALGLAARTFAAGELGHANAEDERFDPLARLGIAARAENAAAAAALFDGNQTFARAAEILRARAAWYDGTGQPALVHDAIPKGAQVLAAAIAYDALESVHRTQIREVRTAPADRLDTAAGTQFDPAVTRALLAVAKARV
ncbi:MAG TPA: HD domain-containing phosphohydrolase [Candidatus Baltobacteraceae bacterium]|jgi:response regulator RpfG family c-di-GMP phosphodiesterase